MMRRWIAAAAVLLGLVWAAPALAVCTLPYQLQNGKISDANQVMANFNSVVACIVDQGPGGSIDQVQYNNNGAFGGLTDTELTARIQPFTASFNGAVAAPISPAGNFLRDDGTWQPVGSGSGCGDATNCSWIFQFGTGTQGFSCDARPGMQSLECEAPGELDTSGNPLFINTGKGDGGGSGGGMVLRGGAGGNVGSGGNIQISSGIGGATSGQSAASLAGSLR